MSSTTRADELRRHLEAAAPIAARVGTNFSEAMHEAAAAIRILQSNQISDRADIGEGVFRSTKFTVSDAPPAPGSQSDPAYVDSLVRRLRELSRWRGAQQIEIDGLLIKASELISALRPAPVEAMRCLPAAHASVALVQKDGARSSSDRMPSTLSRSVDPTIPGAEHASPRGAKSSTALPKPSVSAVRSPTRTVLAIEAQPLHAMVAHEATIAYQIQPTDAPILIPSGGSSEVLPADGVEHSALPPAAAPASTAGVGDDGARRNGTALRTISGSDPNNNNRESLRSSSPDDTLEIDRPPPSPPEPSWLQEANALPEPRPAPATMPVGTPPLLSLAAHHVGSLNPPVQIHSTSGKRVHPRFGLPFSVQIGSSNFPGANLSLGGIALAGPSLPTALGEVYRAAVTFTFPSHEIRVAAHLAAVRRDASERAVAFRFLDLNVDTARILQSITDKWASGDLSTLDPATDLAGPALSLSGSTTRRLRGLGSVFRYGMALTGAALLVWFLATLIYDRWLSIVPEHAAVSSDITLIQAPASGYYRERLPVGTHLKGNDEIGFLVPVTPLQARTEWQLRLSNLKVRYEGQKIALERAQAAYESATRTLTAERDRAGAEQRSLKAQIANLHKALEAMRADMKRGKVTSAQLASEDARLSQLERLLIQSEAAEVLVNEQLRAAGLGLPVLASRTVESAPAEIERELRQTAAAIATLEETLAAAPETTPLRSPCDCILSVVPRDGEYVEAGAALASLIPAQAGSDAASWQVDALLAHEQAQAIATGDPVEIRFGASLEPVTGHVAAVSHDPSPTQRVGVPAPLLASGRFARVTIAVAAQSGQLPPALGTPVSVRFQSALRTRISVPAYLRSLFQYEPASGSTPGTPTP